MSQKANILMAGGGKKKQTKNLRKYDRWVKTYFWEITVEKKNYWKIKNSIHEAT